MTSTPPRALCVPRSAPQNDPLPFTPNASRESVGAEAEYVQLLLHTVHTHDAEKLALLQHLNDAVLPAQAEAQHLQRLLLEREAAIATLHDELSTTRLALQEERERSTRLLHEIAVQHAAPLRPPAPRALRHSTSLRHATRHAEEEKERQDAAEAETELVRALRAEVAALHEALDAQRIAYETERAHQRTRTREAARDQSARLDALLRARDASHALHQRALADVIGTRHSARCAVREMAAAADAWRAEWAAMRSDRRHDRRRRAADIGRAAQRAGRECAAVLERLRAAVETQRATAAAEREAHTQTVTQREAEAHALRQALRTERRKGKREEERHQLEAIGVKSEVNLMRQALRAMEKRVYFSSGGCLSD